MQRLAVASVLEETGGFMFRSLSLASILSLCTAFTCVAQSPNPSASQDSAPTQPDAKKQKKVWTNENLSDANGPISVVGDPKNSSKTKSSAGKPADPQYVANVKKEIEKLQSQIADADKQLVDLKNFSEGEPSPSSGVQLHKSYDRDPIYVQMRGLQEKKKQLQAKIDTLLEEARKKGVEPGQLR
jgi:hypothetical protein